MPLLFKSKGFTLLEILVAIVIFSVSLLALAGVMSTTSRNTSLGNHITEASTFAQDRLEQLRVTPWGTVGSGNDTVTGSTGITYTRTWTVPPAAGKLKTIRMTVSWNDGINHSFDFISAITDEM